MTEEQKQEAANPADKKEKAGKGKSVRKGKKKVKKNVPMGIIYIQSSFNNTLITVTDPQGNTLSWSSGGHKGFKGSRKGTPFAAQLAAEDAVRKAQEHGLKQVKVYLKGPGAGRDQALRSLQKTGIRVTGIRDITPIPHNGCRPPKKRRV